MMVVVVVVVVVVVAWSGEGTIDRTQTDPGDELNKITHADPQTHERLHEHER